MDQSISAIEAAALCLAEPDPVQKCLAVKALHANPPPLRDHPRTIAPGRPKRPQLVNPRDLPKRKLGTTVGHGAFVHAICHIEFTAINLALDAVVRFGGMPATYYADWLGVAAEEAIHYSLLVQHLESLGYAYGDFVAHEGLWHMAERTGDDVLRRMALVPRVMEARGLDVTPNMVLRLEAIGDLTGARILDRILADEIGHVRIGSRWFNYLCDARGLDPLVTFGQLVATEVGSVRAASLNHAARLAAGFSLAELDFLSRPTRI